MHRDRRPDLTVSGAPSPFCFVSFLKSLLFVPVCLSRGMEVAARPSAIAHECSVGVRLDHRESAGRESLKSAAVCGSFKPDVRGRSTPPSAAHPGPPIAGDIRHRPRLSEARRSLKSAVRRESQPAVRGSLKPAVRGSLMSRRHPRLPQVCRPWGKPTRRPRLTQARRLPLTQARRPPLTPAQVPLIQSTRHGQECHVPVGTTRHKHFNLSCLILSTETRLGQAVPRVVAMEASPSRLPLLSLKWKRLLRHLVRAPDSLSCPGEASASKLAQEGFLFLWAVLSCLVPVCLALCGLSCPVCLAPEGSGYPLAAPWIFFWGGTKVPAVVAGPRDEATAKDHLPWPSELPAPPWPPFYLFRSGGPLQSAHPPSPVELLRRGTRLLGGGSYVSPLSCVSCVPASCFHIWFVSCPCLM